MSEVVGTVDQVSVYPVKSLAGRTVAEARVESAGLVGDRAWAVVDATTGERVTVKTTPVLAEVVATGDDEADTITLTEVLGRPVRLQRTSPDGMAPQVDAAAVHLVSRSAIDREGGLRRARPYLGAQLRRLRRRGSARGERPGRRSVAM